MTFKMKGFSGFGNSPLTKRTKPVVPTHGPTDGVTSEEAETHEEKWDRFTTTTYTPSISEIVATRKRKCKENPKTEWVKGKCVEKNK